jgi:3-deoxy-D-manno-octulosonic-acid transferase
MQRFWILLYNIIFIPILYVIFRLGALVNKKIKLGISGRNDLLENLKIKVSNLDKNKPLIWFHSSSLGEFEQAKPILEEFRNRLSINILVTFFSPSGYENAKNYPFADIITYIPFDLYSNAREFVDICHPQAAIVMRYDLWPNHVYFLYKNNIPIFLVDATLRADSPRNRFLIRAFHKQLFAQLSGILTVSESDLLNFSKLVESKNILQAVGDTRFDRVEQKSIAAKERNLIRPEIFEGKKVFVLGSTWSEDEEVLFPVIKKLLQNHESLLFIVVPHEPTETHIDKIEQDFGPEISTIRFSFLNEYHEQPIIIVDSIGILLTLYFYADIAFVGGSFKSSIHNVLEAAVYGIPVVFGPKIQSSHEAQDLNSIGAGFMVKNKSELYRVFNSFLLDEESRKKSGQIALEYIQKNVGATQRIVQYILPYLKKS